MPVKSKAQWKKLVVTRPDLLHKWQKKYPVRYKDLPDYVDEDVKTVEDSARRDTTGALENDTMNINIAEAAASVNARADLEIYTRLINCFNSYAELPGVPKTHIEKLISAGKKCVPKDPKAIAILLAVTGEGEAAFIVQRVLNQRFDELPSELKPTFVDNDETIKTAAWKRGDKSSDRVVDLIDWDGTGAGEWANEAGEKAKLTEGREATGPHQHNCPDCSRGCNCDDMTCTDPREKKCKGGCKPKEKMKGAEVVKEAGETCDRCKDSIHSHMNPENGSHDCQNFDKDGDSYGSPASRRKTWLADQEARRQRYKIVRYYAPGQNRRPRTINTGLTLSQAQAHCSDPSTRKEGVYFDGYVKESINEFAGLNDPPQGWSPVKCDGTLCKEENPELREVKIGEGAGRLCAACHQALTETVEGIEKWGDCKVVESGPFAPPRYFKQMAKNAGYQVRKVYHVSSRPWYWTKSGITNAPMNRGSWFATEQEAWDAAVADMKKNGVKESVNEAIKRRAKEIDGRNMQLLEEPEDIKWALEVHGKSHPEFTPSNTKGVIITGNEDSPDSIWATTATPANHLETIFTRIGGAVKESVNEGASSNEEVIRLFISDGFPKNKRPEWGTANLKIKRCPNGWALVNYWTVILFRQNGSNEVLFNNKKYSPTTSRIQHQIQDIAQEEVVSLKTVSEQEAKEAAEAQPSSAPVHPVQESEDEAAEYASFYADPIVKKVLELNPELQSERRESGDVSFAFEIADALHCFATDWNSHEPLIQKIWAFLREHKYRPAPSLSTKTLNDDEHINSKLIYDSLEMGREKLENWARGLKEADEEEPEGDDADGNEEPVAESAETLTVVAKGFEKEDDAKAAASKRGIKAKVVSDPDDKTKFAVVEESAESSKTQMWAVRLKHDDGEVTIKTMASNEAGAKKAACTAEGAPESAVLSVTKIDESTLPDQVEQGNMHIKPTRDNQLWHARQLADTKGLEALRNPHAMIGKDCGCGDCFCCAAAEVYKEKSGKEVSECVATKKKKLNPFRKE